jgi:DNA-binding NtrC family response regulator
VANSLLLVDDDPAVLRAVGNYFESIGTEVYRASSAAAALEAYERARPDVVILDMGLPDANGLEVLEHLRGQGGAVIILTGQGDIETAVRAMQLGAENFLTKPIDMPHLAAATTRVAEKVRLKRQNQMLRARDHAGESVTGLGVSPQMADLGRQIEMLAASERTTFLESELFGHEKGAFTDAKERKQGLFELADGGTVFLDEIGDLALELQPKLLKVLETKTFRRLGGTREMKVDVRLVAATNRDLIKDVEGGRFREDLYYRLSVMPLHLPAVRDRSREDRHALIERILGEIRPQLPGSPPDTDGEALERLLGAPWPGNIREMRNVLERALILARGQPAIGPEHLPPDLRGRPGSGERRHHAQSLADVERTYIERALRYHGGNRTRAAKELGISRATLINKIKVYELDL